MPTAFLSYAQEDLETAKQIEEQLTNHGIGVWRDQEELRAGQNWPKALGEAIAASDALVLLWSNSAAASAFVELEWCTALALRKPVLPCLRDDTPLPASLASIEAVQLTGSLEAAAQRISSSLAYQQVPADRSETEQVIRSLAKIGGGTQSEVLRKAKAAFAAKTWLEKWQAWVAIFAVATAVTLAIQLVHSNAAASKHSDSVATQPTIQDQTIAGSIWDKSGEPLPNVSVSVLLDNKVMASGATDALGHFSFHFPAAREAEITLIAQKNEYHTEKRYTHLGNPGFNFQMQRKQN
jgi:hypothetical protein